MIVIDGTTYYRTLEVCRRAGISRATLFRWMEMGILTAVLRDRRGWRLFTERDLDVLRTESGKIEIERFPLKENGNGQADRQTIE